MILLISLTIFTIGVSLCALFMGVPADEYRISRELKAVSLEEWK